VSLSSQKAQKAYIGSREAEVRKENKFLKSTNLFAKRTSESAAIEKKEVPIQTKMS